jgi:hypothetical protein
MNQPEMSRHLKIENLGAQFIPDSGSPLILAVSEFSAVLSYQGLSVLVAALIPEEPLRVSIVDQPAATGCLIRIQATRLGFNPRITVSLTKSSSLPGAILINVDPHSRWSLIDRVMLGIAISNLDKVARSEPALSRIGPGAYQFDLQGMIRDRLLESSAPVRWDARLERIDGRDAEIRVGFVSTVTRQDA